MVGQIGEIIVVFCVLGVVFRCEQLPNAFINFRKERIGLEICMYPCNL